MHRNECTKKLILKLNTVLKDLDIYGDGALRFEDLIDTLSFKKDHPL